MKPTHTPDEVPNAGVEPVVVASEIESARETNFPIVGIGASAGGLEAFSELLANLPVDTGMGFVLVQHLSRDHKSALAELLSKVSRLPVEQVSHDLKVMPNRVYIVPPDRDLTVVQGVLQLRPRPPGPAVFRSIDSFLESLAVDRRERAIGIVLSGAASDGTLGLESIKAAGGVTFAQDASAKFDSMPSSAIAAGCVDLVLAPAAIAMELAHFASRPRLMDAVREATVKDSPETGVPIENFTKEPVHDGESGEASYKSILLQLGEHTGVDFFQYKPSTIQRRIRRRMVLNKLSFIEDYAAFLRNNARELDLLHSDVLIHVTCFFRNPETFDYLKKKVFPRLLKERGEQGVRIWIPGCSTGQEAYSIAIALTEVAGGIPGVPKFQIFATDLKGELLVKARAALYSEGAVEDISPERLKRFFTEEGGGYRVRKSIRENVVFAEHNLLRDPPFSRLDLICCRNLLIYLEAGIQKAIFPSFHYALAAEGFLFLGASESVNSNPELFATLDKKHKIFSKIPGPSPVTYPLSRHPAGKKELGSVPSVRVSSSSNGEVNLQRESDRVAINLYVPCGVLINSGLQILQFRGDTSRWLKQASGRASFDLLKMAREGLAVPLGEAVKQAQKDRRNVRRENVRVEDRSTNLTVIPLINLKELCCLIFFEEPEALENAAANTPAGIFRRQVKETFVPALFPPDAANLRIADLEQQLVEARDGMQSFQEESEATNEELQATNEEGTSANEELQSVNEELETSKEEIESANEELATINEELNLRNADLRVLNADLANLQASSHFAIVLLGRDLRIRRFTPQAERELTLTSADLGQMFNDARHNLDMPELAGLITGVIKTGREFEREIQNKLGRWVSVRVRPYVAADHKIDGAVLALVDIDVLKRSEQAITFSRDFAESVLRTAPNPLIVLDANLRIETANHAFYDTFKIAPVDAQACLIYDLGNGEWDIPKLRELLERILPDKSVFDKFEVAHDFERIGHRTMLLNGRALKEPDGRRSRIVLGIQDITERKLAEQALAEKARLLDLSNDAIIVHDLHYKITLWNKGAEKLYGWMAEEMVGHDLHTRLQTTFSQPLHEIIAQLHLQGFYAGEVVQVDRNGRRIPSLCRWVFDRDTKSFLTSYTDITARKEAETEIARVRDESVAASRAKDDFIAALSHELRTPLNPVLLIASDGASNPAFSHDAQAAFGTIAKNAQLEAYLIDDLLDLTKIAHGKMALEMRPVDVHAVLNEALATMDADHKEKRLVLTHDLGAETYVVLGDPVRLQQVFWNVLKNAVKFTPANGSIRIVTRLAKSNDKVTIEIVDSGIGMTPEEIGRIFEAFSQGDHATGGSHRFGGLGLGLAISRMLVRLHAGHLSATSEGRGRGTTFSIELPLVREKNEFVGSRPANIPKAPVEKTPTSRRILLVEDHDATRRVLADLLSRRAHQVVTASTATEALARASAQPFDLVISDIGLPDGDGHSLMDVLKTRHGLKGIAMTGYGMEQDIARGLAAGFVRHLTKPVSIQQLEAAIAFFDHVG
jgi:two-component system CheB/CheR fusion protein